MIRYIQENEPWATDEVKDINYGWFLFEEGGYKGLIKLSCIEAITEEDNDKINVYCKGDGIAHFTLNYNEGIALIEALGLGGTFDE